MVPLARAPQEAQTALPCLDSYGLLVRQARLDGDTYTATGRTRKTGASRYQDVGVHGATSMLGAGAV